MATYISDKAKKLAVCASITYDLTRFGPRQLKALVRQARTGLCKGRSLTTQIAKRLRAEHGLGYIVRHAWGVSWMNLKPNEFAYLDASALTARINGSPSAKRSEHLDAQRQAINDRVPSGWLATGYKQASVPVTQKEMFLPVSPELDALLIKIEKGELNELTLNLL